MASLIRHVGRLSRVAIGTSSRSIQSGVTPEEIEKSVSEDMPVKLEKNPYEKEKQQCILCRLNIEPDYKNVRFLSQFQSMYTGKIYGRHITGLCLDKQKRVEREILKAQNAGLMSYYHKDPKYLKDPILFNPARPLRPHRF